MTESQRLNRRLMWLRDADSGLFMPLFILYTYLSCDLETDWVLLFYIITLKK
jgi:hypothetical protein